jgi:hypothetical protein
MYEGSFQASWHGNHVATRGRFEQRCSRAVMGEPNASTWWWIGESNLAGRQSGIPVSEDIVLG